MRERPILFSGAMVRAILEGRKTMTRRVVKDVSSDITHWQYLGDGQWNPMFSIDWMTKKPLPEPVGKAWCHRCPYGQPGDRLWVRETHRFVDGGENIDYVCDGEVRRVVDNSGWLRPEDCAGKFRPSIFMPRWASRITLEITGIRVERLQDISAADAIEEGIEKHNDLSWKNYIDGNGCFLTRDSFESLWDSINGKPRKDGVDISWAANPWVWAVEFQRLEK